MRLQRLTLHVPLAGFPYLWRTAHVTTEDGNVLPTSRLVIDSSPSDGRPGSQAVLVLYVPLDLIDVVADATNGAGSYSP